MAACQSKPDASGRGLAEAQVQANESICREHFRLRLGTRDCFAPTRAGQFVQLGCRPPQGEQDQVCQHEWKTGQRLQVGQAELREPLALLRRPFSLSGRGNDDDGDWIEIIYRTVGVGTDWMARLKAGDRVDMIGPLGNGFGLPQGRSIGLLVAGGVGVGPIFHLAEALHHADWDAVGFLGSTTADLLAADRDSGDRADSINQFSRFGFPSVVATEDGSVGLAGMVTDGLAAYLADQSIEQAEQSVVFTCGPTPMMRAVAELAADHGVDCQVCLEQSMACGMGTCQSCVVKVREDDGRAWRYRLTCTDGPVFPAKDVVWSDP